MLLKTNLKEEKKEIIFFVLVTYTILQGITSIKGLDG